MGPGQHDPPPRRRVIRVAKIALDTESAPPDWFAGVVHRTTTGRRELWWYGRRLLRSAVPA